MQNLPIKETIELEGYEDIPPGDYRDQLVKARVGQNFFRTTVLNAYGNHCCVTGLAKPDLLIASHIKPWSTCDEKTEQTNPSNGLCLNSFHDKAFDKGFITIDPKYRIIISKQLKDVEMDMATREWFWDYEGKQIALPDKFLPDKKFIEYHNDLIFKG